MKKLVLTLLILLYSFGQALAQRFPITVIPQVNPPAPVNFYNYADGTTTNSPLRVQLLLSDITISREQIRLKVSFEGNGIAFESRDVVVGAPTLLIDGGIPLVLTNAELAPYFEFQNLQGINSNVYSRTIPEGSYQFCFEVFDFTTGNRLSSKTCANTYIFKNEPPILNLPLDGVNIEPKEVDNIVFQWTPRHINVSNVEYELSIVEIWDDFVDPQTAFLSLPPVFETTTRATSFVYGPTQPLLLPEKRYAWRVRAKALQGAEEVGLFRNEGNSEIFWFSRTSPCTVPINVYAEPKGISKINVFWDEDPSVYTEYTIAYREANKPNAEWFTMRTNSGWATVWDLKPGTTYEYKVKGKCKYQYGLFSEIQEITTATAQDETANYNCGIVPDAIAITNREPHPNLQIGDRITAGDFVMTITELDSNNSGRITGRGYVKVPYFKFARFGVKFDNVLVNTDNQLAEGEIVTLYDPAFGEGEGMTVDVDLDVVEMITGDQGELSSAEVDFVIADIKPDENNAWVITGTNGEQAIVPGGQDVVIRDESGTAWTIGEDGTISQEQVADGGPVTEESTTGLANGDVSEISATGVRIDFEKSGFYAFDEMPNNVKEQLRSKYKSLTMANGEVYHMPYKVISDIKGEDKIRAKATFSDSNITKEDIVFKTKEGIEVSAEWSGDIATLSLKKKSDYLIEEILATVKPKDSTEKYKIAGAFNLVHLGKPEMYAINLVIVPVNNANVNTRVRENINAIYNKAGVNFKINIGDRLQIPESVWDIDKSDQIVNAGESGVLNYSSKEEKAIHEYFKTQTNYNEQTYYLFVTDLKAVNSDTKEELEGFMPLKGQFGFVFQKSKDQSTTIAHELGHGVFGLEHPFVEYKTPEKSTEFLMDYKGGTVFNHMDWKKIHAPGFKLYWFQGDEEGESNSSAPIKQDRMITILDHIKTNLNGDTNFLKWKQLAKVKGGQGNNRTFYKLRKGDYKVKVGDNNELEFKLITTPSLDAPISEEIQISRINETIKIDKKDGYGISRVYDIVYQITTQDNSGKDKFVFEFDHYDDVEKFYNYLKGDSDSFLTTEISKSIINYLNEAVFPKDGIQANTDCNEIDLYFSEIPSNYIKKAMEIPKLWKVLEVLLTCIIDENAVDEEKAVFTIIDALASADEDVFLTKIMDKKLEDKTMFQLLVEKLNSKKESKSFVEIVGDLTSRLNNDTDKWRITNKIINQQYEEGFYKFHKFLKYKEGRQALNAIFSSIHTGSSSDNVPVVTELFVQMLVEDCKHLDDYKIIYQIANDRYRNREAFAKFTQSEKISLNNGTIKSSSTRSWVLPYNLKLNNSSRLPVPAKDAFFWANKLSNGGSYNREDIKKNELLKKPYKDFFTKFRQEYKTFLRDYNIAKENFWKNITVDNVVSKYQEIVNHINQNENAKSLRYVKSDIKIALLKNIITKPIKDESIYEGIQDDALLKVAISFRPKDMELITAIEEIGFKVIYKKLSGDRLSKFLAWFGRYITDADKIIKLEANDISINGKLLTENDLKRSNKPFVIRQEDNIFQLENDEIFLGKGNSFRVNGGQVAYNQTVLFYVVDDFKFLNFQFRKGQVLSMPIIQAFAMSNSITNRVLKESAWLTADVVSFAIGIGAAKVTFKAGNLLAKAAYTSGITGAGINITMNAINESAVDADTRSRLLMIGTLSSIPGQIKDIVDLNNYIIDTRKRVNNISGLKASSKDRINKYIDDLSAKVPGVKNTKVIRIEAITGGIEELKDFNTWIYTVPSNHPILQKLVDLNEDVTNFAKDFVFKTKNIRDDFIKTPELIDAWAVVKDFQDIRKEMTSLRALQVVSNRFEYLDIEGFKGLKRLMSEGSDANKRALIKGFMHADQLFPEQIPVKYKIGGTKKGAVRAIVIEDGKKQEIARIFKGQLSKKKRYLTQGTVKREFEGSKILQDGDEIGFEINDINKEILETGDFIDAIRIHRVKTGIKVGIAVIGKAIKSVDGKKGKANKFLSKLEKLKVKEIKTFDEISQSLKTFIIDGKSYTWQELIEDFKNKEGIYKTDSNGQIIKSEIPNTLLYKANKQWCQEIIDEGYEVLDIGKSFDGNESDTFYELQLEMFFK
ncbi:fibronectin type III domain-containing protein [Aquimarina algiphila]|uniref:fibronectin type III domain-containing protein n=1 Tax=Aquimarina algiphila TaxID=2047982 RepID=UPI00232D9DE5|nr:fibronectin type III domain-containing protein [Aquimarina algiphila]